MSPVDECGEVIPGSECKGPELGMVLACLRDSKDEPSMARAGQVAIGREGNWCWHRLISDRFYMG